MAMSVAAKHAKGKFAQDKIFGANAAANARAAEIGKANVTNATIGAILDEEENLVCLPTVEKVYNYRYHEKLLTYAECDEGAFCVGQKDENNFVYYTFSKDEKGYKLPTLNSDDTVKRSSNFGVYMLKRFDNQMLIVTQAENSAYNGVAFKPCSSGYYSYTVVYGEFNYSKLTCCGEKVTLV